MLFRATFVPQLLRVIGYIRSQMPMGRLVGVVFAIQIVGLVLLYLQHVVLAQLLTEQAYGSYIFATNSAQLLALISGMGFSLSALKFIAEYNNTHEYHLLVGFIWFAVRLIIGVSIVITCVAIVGAGFFMPINVDHQVVLLGLWLTPLMALEIFGASVIRGFQQVVRAQLPTQIVKPIIMLLVVLLLVSSTDWKTSFAGLGGLAAALIVTVLLEMGFVGHNLHQRQSTSPMGFEYQTWLKTTLPQWGELSLVNVGDRAPIILVGFLLGAEEVALFAIVTRLADIVFFVNYSANQVFAPMIAPLYRNSDTLRLQSLIFFAARISFLGAVGIGIVVLFFSDFILGLFGSAYTGPYATLLLVVLMLGRIGNSLTGVGSYILAMTRYEDDLFAIRLLSVGSSLLFIVLTVPQIGLLGAALGKAVAVLVSDIAIYFRIRQKLRLQAFVIGIG